MAKTAGMTLHQHRRFYTPEQYLELEDKSQARHEYYDGEVFMMSGGTLEHNDIVCNLVIGHCRPSGSTCW